MNNSKKFSTILFYCLMIISVISIFSLSNANKQINNLKVSINNVASQINPESSIQQLNEIKTDIKEILESKTTNLFYLSGFIIVTLSGLLFVFFNQSFDSPMNDFLEHLKSLNNEPLKEYKSNNLFINSIVNFIETQQSKQTGYYTKIKSSVANLKNLTQEVIDSVNSSNEHLDKQQYDMEQVGSAINQMSLTVQEVASNTSSAADAAIQAREEAMSGQNVVSETKKSIQALADEVQAASDVIQKLRDDSNNIGSVLDVIRGISDQTNLLALNAAIEAARAGEAGRGFAVVADEVRTLAQRTGESTEEIQNMIERLQNGAQQAVDVMEMGRKRAIASVEHASTANSSLNSITESIQRISDLNTQIATAAEEQSTTADGIHSKIINITSTCDSSVKGVRSVMNISNNIHTVLNTFEQDVLKD